MGRVIVEEMYIFAKNLFNNLLKNSDKYGGRTCLITGEQGSGKTTMLRRLAEAYLSQGTVVIWRGRPVEQIHWIPNWKERCVFFHHANDEFKAYDVRGTVSINITDDLEIKEYTGAYDLYTKVVEDKINVVYEPTTFYFSEGIGLIDVVYKSVSKKAANKLLERPQEGNLFWFELIYVLIHRHDTRWFALLLDEADDIFPESPQGIRWRFQEWAKNVMRDLRKTRTNFVICTHAINDLDYRIRSKIQFWIYMKNSKVPRTSIVKPYIPSYLKRGQFIIENGLFGVGVVEPYEPPKMGDFKIVLTPKTAKKEGRENVDETEE